MTYLPLAQTKYNEMLNENTWNGIHSTKSTESVSMLESQHAPPHMGAFDQEYWNCADKHHVDECRQPKDQTRIEANHKKSMNKKRRRVQLLRKRSLFLTQIGSISSLEKTTNGSFTESCMLSHGKPNVGPLLNTLQTPEAIHRVDHHEKHVGSWGIRGLVPNLFPNCNINHLL
jgi:hypothetical protein